MIIKVFTALHNLENTTNDFKTAINGQFSPYIAKQDATYPFATYQDIVDIPTWTYNTEMNSLLIQIDIYGNDTNGLTILDVQEKAWALFDGATLTITDWNHMIMLRQAHRFTREEDPNIWRSSTDYLVQAQKQ